MSIPIVTDILVDNTWSFKYLVKACKNKNIYFNNCGFSKDQEGDDLILGTRYQLYEIKPDLKKRKKKKRFNKWNKRKWSKRK